MSLAASGADGANRFQVLRPPVVPVLPIGPNRSLYLILAAAFAVLAGLAAAYLRGAMPSGVFVSPRELGGGLPASSDWHGLLGASLGYRRDEAIRAPRRANLRQLRLGGCARPGCARLAQHAGSCSAWDGNRKQCGLGAAECYVSLKGGYDERQFTAPANVAGHRTRRR